MLKAQSSSSCFPLDLLQSLLFHSWSSILIPLHLLPLCIPSSFPPSSPGPLYTFPCTSSSSASPPLYFSTFLSWFFTVKNQPFASPLHPSSPPGVSCSSPRPFPIGLACALHNSPCVGQLNNKHYQCKRTIGSESHGSDPKCQGERNDATTGCWNKVGNPSCNVKTKPT